MGFKIIRQTPSLLSPSYKYINPQVQCLLLGDTQWNLGLRSLLMPFSIHRLCFNLKGGGGGSGVARQHTHISLGNLLSFAGVLKGADTQIWDGDSRTGRKCDQHKESPQAALQRQLQAVGLLQRECCDIHFTPRNFQKSEKEKWLTQGHCGTSKAHVLHFIIPQTLLHLSSGLLSSEGSKCSPGSEYSLPAHPTLKIRRGRDKAKSKSRQHQGMANAKR